MINVKFQSVYLSKLAEESGKIDKFLSLITALTSSGSVAALAVWQEFPWIWASVVFISQLINIGRPFFPQIKNTRSYIEYSYDLDRIYLEYEKKWIDCENNSFEKADNVFKKMRNKEFETNEKYKMLFVPNNILLRNKSRKEVDGFLAIHYQ